MGIETRPIQYHDGGVTLEGTFASDGKTSPTILVCHAWSGCSDFEIQTARKMAEWGYAGFAVDVFGKGVRGQGPQQCAALIKPFLNDRSMLQGRLQCALDAVKAQPEVDGRLAVIGFCFGGLCALDLARAGGDVLGAVSFHGNLTPPGNTTGNRLKPKVLALHGWDDPLVPHDQVTAFCQEMTAAGADWQLHAYGGTVHGFMMPQANQPAMGVVFNPVSARRGWAALRNFLAEIFDGRAAAA
jgi:dienelactone hydrolase